MENQDSARRIASRPGGCGCNKNRNLVPKHRKIGASKQPEIKEKPRSIKML